MTLQEARKIIIESPSYPLLRKANTRFVRRLYGKDSDYPEQIEKTIDAEPELLLIAHAGVIDEKSSVCKSMKTLTNQIFKQTGLPRKPQGKFRGASGLDTSHLLVEINDNN